MTVQLREWFDSNHGTIRDVIDEADLVRRTQLELHPDYRDYIESEYKGHVKDRVVELCVSQTGASYEEVLILVDELLRIP